MPILETLPPGDSSVPAVTKRVMEKKTRVAEVNGPTLRWREPEAAANSNEQAFVQRNIQRMVSDTNFGT